MNLISKAVAGSLVALCANTAIAAPVLKIDWTGTNAYSETIVGSTGDTLGIVGDLIGLPSVIDDFDLEVVAAWTKGDPALHIGTILEGDTTGTLTITYGDTGFTGGIGQENHFFSNSFTPDGTFEDASAALFLNESECDLSDLSCFNAVTSATAIWSGIGTGSGSADLSNIEESYGLVIQQTFNIDGVISGSADYDVSVSESGSLALLALGLAGLSATRQRKAK